MLSLDHVTMSFGGLIAVDDVSFTIEKGRITGLIGPNGAGKTTAFNVLAGHFRPTSGRIFLAGEDVTALAAHERSRKGLARTFQLPHEFARLTAIENLMVAGSSRQGEGVLTAILNPGRFRAEEREVWRRALDLLDFLELSKACDERAGNLSGGQKKLLELGRALMANPRIVLLDEIGAGINRTLLGKIAEKIRRLNAELGLAFCVIEHDLDYVARICEDVIVMAEGSVLMRGSVEDVRADERVIEVYFGGGRHERRA
ncbi:MAG: ABC transporter ATP-binding protein [Parvibaculaceae bacterium]